MKVLLCLLCVGAFSVNASAEDNEFRRFEINWNVLSYQKQGSVNFYGATLGFGTRINRTIGIVADLGIHEDSPVDLITYRFGPRFYYVDRKHFTAFGQILAGGARLRVGSLAHADGLAFYSGAGVDVGIKPWLAWRAVDAGFSSLHYSQGWSNGGRVSTGIVFRFTK
jgi:hypothetical protein